MMEWNPILRRTLQGLLLSAGAPAGWLLIRLAGRSTFHHELGAHASLYLYMYGATAVAFALFGAFGGRREEQLERVARDFEGLAITDPLTNLPNRRYFQQRLREAVAATRRGEGALGLAIIDIDHFKRVNDVLGHDAGDRVLVAVGAAMAQEARAGETVARIGGEELALILPGADLEIAREAAERIRLAASAEVERRGHLPASWPLTLSAGVTAVAAGARCSTRDLLVSADRALYRAKALGRDRVEILEPRQAPETSRARHDSAAPSGRGSS